MRDMPEVIWVYDRNGRLEARDFDVQYTRGAHYRYYGVTQEAFDGFLLSSSPGRYLQNFIIGKFTGVCMRGGTLGAGDNEYEGIDEKQQKEI